MFYLYPLSQCILRAPFFHKYFSSRSLNLGQTTRSCKNQQKKKKKEKKKERTYRTADFTVPAEHRVKLKESEKKDKFLGLPRKLGKLRNMKVTIIPNVIGALSTVT